MTAEINASKATTEFDLNNLQAMKIEELWSLHVALTAILTAKIKEERSELEKRLVLLKTGIGPLGARPSRSRKAKEVVKRRPYPPVFPKYQNPANAAEKWSGRGKQPRWLAAQLKAGKRIEDFQIVGDAANRRRGVRRPSAMRLVKGSD